MQRWGLLSLYAVEYLVGPSRKLVPVVSDAVLTGCETTARLWEIPVPAQRNPKRLLISIEVRTGYTWNPIKGEERLLTFDPLWQRAGS